jgi:hypothetical protein
MPWHYQHHECDDTGRNTRSIIPSFVLVVLHAHGQRMIPMEHTVMTGCALCAVLGRIVTYDPAAGNQARQVSMELKTTSGGSHHTTWITPQHGICANDLLLELLEGLEPSEVVYIHVHVSRI